MALYVYMLRCVDGSYYTGHTDNVEARLAAHKQGQISGYTQARRPVRLVFVEGVASRQVAFERERQIKVGRGRRNRPLLNKIGKV